MVVEEIDARDKQLATDREHNCCKEICGATSVMPVIRDAFRQQAVDATQ